VVFPELLRGVLAGDSLEDCEALLGGCEFRWEVRTYSSCHLLISLATYSIDQ
jgi:hypothetical protein